MRIIGHRGANGHLTGNTLGSIKKAIELGVDGVEFDVWTSKDGVPIVHHDNSLQKTTGQFGYITDLTSGQIRELSHSDGQNIPTVKEAFNVIKNSLIVMEIKEEHLSKGVYELLLTTDATHLRVISFKKGVLLELRQKVPEIKLYATTHYKQIKTIRFAAKHGLAGVTLDYRFFNPISYWLARKKGLETVLYKVNSPLYVKILKLLRAKVDIATDFPDMAIKIVR